MQTDTAPAATKLYVLRNDEVDSQHPVAVFSTRELAEQAKPALIIRNGNDLVVEEFDLDKY